MTEHAPEAGARRRPGTPQAADPWDTPPPSGPQPGILEALSYAHDCTVGVRTMTEADLTSAVNDLEKRLAPMLKASPPALVDVPGSNGPLHGPGGDYSSEIASSVTGLGHTATETARRLGGIVSRLRELADRVDLA